MAGSQSGTTSRLAARLPCGGVPGAAAAAPPCGLLQGAEPDVAGITGLRGAGGLGVGRADAVEAVEPIARGRPPSARARSLPLEQASGGDVRPLGQRRADGDEVGDDQEADAGHDDVSSAGTAANSATGSSKYITLTMRR